MIRYTVDLTFTNEHAEALRQVIDNVEGMLCAAMAGKGRDAARATTQFTAFRKLVQPFRREVARRGRKSKA
jgi:hypothetical protein